MILRSLSALVACVLVAVALLIWQLSRGPVSLNFMTPYVEDALQGAQGEWRVDVQELILMSDLKLHARAVSLLDQQGTPVLHVPDLVVRPSLRGLMQGFAAVRAIEISGAQASIMRRADGTFGISVAGAPQEAPASSAATKELLEELLQPASSEYAIGFLHRVRILDARVNVEDLESGASWSVQDLDIGLVRSPEGQELTLRALLPAAKDSGPPTAFDATLSVRPSGAGFALQGKAKAAPIDVGRLGLYWPQNVAVAARRWVTKNIPKGRVPEVVANLSMDSDSGVDFRLTRLDGQFRYEGLEVHWSDEAPPVTAVVGTSTFDGGSMHFEIEDGMSSGIDIASAKVDLSGLDVDKERLELSVNGSGPFAAVLALLPGVVELPFHTEGDTGLQVSSAFPLRAKLDFSDVDLKVDAHPDSLKVDHSAASAVVSGQLRYRKAVKAVATLTADLDLRDARVESGAFLWTQPPGSKGKLAFHTEPTTRPLKLDPLRIDCTGFDVRGNVVIGDAGASGAFDLFDITYGKTNLDRLEAQWTPSATTVRIGKGILDLQPFLKEDAGQKGASAEVQPIDLDINVDGGVRISLDRNSWVENVKATLIRQNGEFRRIDISADLPRKLWSADHTAPADTKKSFWLKLEPSGPGRRLEAAAPDFGALLKAVDVSNGVRGGTLVISGRADKMEGGHVIRSHVKVTDFVLAEAPLVVRILTVAALDKFVSTLKGDGLHFDSLKGTVTARGDRYEIADFRAYGSSVGFTAAGWVDIGIDEMSLDGAVIPAYVANQVVKNIPLLGDLLAGSDKRGLIAINYKVRGALKDPKVTANPLSALTPGILRGLWEIGE